MCHPHTSLLMSAEQFIPLTHKGKPRLKTGIPALTAMEGAALRSALRTPACKEKLDKVWVLILMKTRLSQETAASKAPLP